MTETTETLTTPAETRPGPDPELMRHLAGLLARPFAGSASRPERA